MERMILVSSSSGEDSYHVNVSSTAEHGITIMCDCAAGEWGKYCKHKMAVALGDATILYDDEQYSGPHKWDNVLRCIFNQMEIPNGQKKVQQGIEGSNRAW